MKTLNKVENSDRYMDINLVKTYMELNRICIARHYFQRNSLWFGGA